MLYTLPFFKVTRCLQEIAADDLVALDGDAAHAVAGAEFHRDAESEHFLQLAEDGLFGDHAEFRRSDLGFQVSFLLQAQADLLEVLVDLFAVVDVLAGDGGKEAVHLVVLHAPAQETPGDRLGREPGENHAGDAGLVARVDLDGQGDLAVLVLFVDGRPPAWL